MAQTKLKSALAGIGVIVVAGIALTVAATHNLGVPQEQGAVQASAAAGKWVKTCAKDDAGADVCFVEQFVLTPDGKGILLQVQIGYFGKDGAPRLSIKTPPDASPEKGLVLVLDQGQPIALPFGVCNSEGCVGGAALAEDIFTAFKTGTVLNVRYLRKDGTKAGLPVGMENLAAALKTIAPE